MLSEIPIANRDSICNFICVTCGCVHLNCMIISLYNKIWLLRSQFEYKLEHWDLLLAYFSMNPSSYYVDLGFEVYSIFLFKRSKMLHDTFGIQILLKFHINNVFSFNTLWMILNLHETLFQSICVFPFGYAWHIWTKITSFVMFRLRQRHVNICLLQVLKSF